MVKRSDEREVRLLDDLALLRVTRMVTARYAGFERVKGVPIRTTVGAPRYWRADRQGDLHKIAAIAPYGIFGTAIPVDDMKPLYLQRCEDMADEIVQRLAEVAREHPGEPLCLLCYEDIHSGDECHRRWFAEWFEQQFGIAIPEWAPRQEPTLFDEG